MRAALHALMHVRWLMVSAHEHTLEHTLVMHCIPPCVCEIHGVLRARFRAVRWVLCVCLYMQISMLRCLHIICICVFICTYLQLLS